MIAHCLAGTGVGGDYVCPRALRERHVETGVDRVIELGSEAHCLWKVLLQRHARDGRFGELCQPLLCFRLRQLPADRAALQGISGVETPQ